MQLFTREWGTGARHAVLVHGVLSDSRNWRRVGPALAELGYHVIAPDLPGHGQSPRAQKYTMDVLVESLLESVPERPELAMGHSLGGLTLSESIARLQPERAIYVDPAFSMPALTFLQRMFVPIIERRILKSTADQIASQNPRWEAADVAIEAEDFAAFDRTLFPLLTTKGVLRAPTRLEVPSLIVLAENSHMVPASLATELTEDGFEVRVVSGTTHTVNRDDFDGFMTALDGWV